MIRFFVVEDHALTNLGIRELLTAQGNFECSGYALNSSQALKKLENGSLPDILLLDLFLGEDSGIELLREINKRFPSIKVLVYSMFEKPGIVSLALENGAKGFVSKSASEEELLTAIKNIAGGDGYVQHNLVPQLITYHSMLDCLTKQEQRIFKSLLERKQKPQIAKELNLALRSIDNYLSRIYSKTGCADHEDLLRRFGE